MRRHSACKSEMVRMKKATFEEKISYNKTRLEEMLDKFEKLEESMCELQKINQLLKSQKSTRGPNEDLSLKNVSIFGSTMQFESRLTKS